jgi:DNA-binding transcriptional MerR regulator
LSKHYRIHEFAELAGVTVKALHHYDRLGLLQPDRTAAGYRLYSDPDLERLEQIIALKFIGLPLKQIQLMLDRAALDLGEALRSQRQALESQQQLLARAISAIRAAEAAIEHGKPANPAILRRIIEVIDMQDSIDEMRRYFTAGAWQKCRPYYELWPSAEWRSLYRDVEAALSDDPSAGTAQSLAIRWMQLVESESGGDAEARAGMFAAWRDRHYWPLILEDRMAEFPLDQIWEFISRAILSLSKEYYNNEPLAKTAGLTRDTGEYELFIETVGGLGGDPSSMQSRTLAERWWELISDAGQPRPLTVGWKELAAQEVATADGAIRRQVALFNIEKVWGFVAKASYPA